MKRLLTSAPIMQPPNWNMPFEIMCDASDYAIGAVLGQRVGKASHAIYYAFRTFNDACKHVFVRVGTVLTLNGVATNHVVEV